MMHVVEEKRMKKILLKRGKGLRGRMVGGQAQDECGIKIKSQRVWESLIASVVEYIFHGIPRFHRVIHILEHK